MFFIGSPCSLVVSNSVVVLVVRSPNGHNGECGCERLRVTADADGRWRQCDQRPTAVLQRYTIMTIVHPQLAADRHVPISLQIQLSAGRAYNNKRTTFTTDTAPVCASMCT
jgi:hypothetical protein